MSDIITYHSLAAANQARQQEWDKQGGIDASYRGNEMAGEGGEALEAAMRAILLGAAIGRACNIIKKLERERLGIRGSRAPVADLADELADVVICADLVAGGHGIDLMAAVQKKFNATSEKIGLATRLALDMNLAQRADDLLRANNALVDRARTAERALASLGPVAPEQLEASGARCAT